MTPESSKGCDQAARVSGYLLHALPASEVAVVEAHISVCPECRREMEMLRPIVDFFVSWPTDVLRPSPSLWGRIARRIAAEKGEEPVVPTTRQWSEQEWEEVAPGISCKLLASDTERNRVSMFVRLAPGVHYPPHSHAGVEELHLLHGELWINDRKLYPGDYNRAEPNTADQRVWSETGCTCVLITSPGDVLRPQVVTAAQ
jgi:anti-sigma factor ChrR (cupin superfamily)